MNIKEQMRELINKIEKASYEYYTLDNPTVSDEVYDQWLRELINLEETYPELKKVEAGREPKREIKQ